MKKFKIYAGGYTIVFMILFMGLVFGIMSGVVVAIKEFYNYFIEQPKPEIEEILDKMKEELKNVD